MNNEATPPPADLVALSEKATPGPWTVADHDDYGDFDGNSRVILGDDRRIGVIQVKSADDEEDNANAELPVGLVNWFRSQDWTRPSLSAQAVGDGVSSVIKEMRAACTCVVGGSNHGQCKPCEWADRLRETCSECGGTGGERWQEQDGSENGRKCASCDGFGHQ